MDLCGGRKGGGGRRWREEPERGGGRTEAERVVGRNGKSLLRKKIEGYNAAARYAPWIVLIDLDSDADCPVRLRDRWLSQPAPHLCFRVAVREIEAWLMADAESLARYLSVERRIVARDPEGIEKPKAAMVELARRSSRRDLRKDMVPGAESGLQAGPGYAGRMIEYAGTAWRPGVAARSSESLRRAIDCLRRLVAARREAPA